MTTVIIIADKGEEGSLLFPVPPSEGVEENAGAGVASWVVGDGASVFLPSLGAGVEETGDTDECGGGAKVLA